MSRLLPLWLLLVGCGGATDPGGGTGTLFAQVLVSGRADSTLIEVELSARGNPVIGANVYLRDVERDQELTASPLSSAGLYRATVGGWARTVAIEVTAGRDDFYAQLEGPGPHAIVRPGNDQVVRPGDFDYLLVRWEASDGPADRVELFPERGPPLQLEGDPFEARVPLEPLAPGEQRLRVVRERSVELRGATSGSVMRARYEVDNRFALEG